MKTPFDAAELLGQNPKLGARGAAEVAIMM
jgi:hypothetical protein